MKKILKYLLFILILAVVLIQFVPVERSNPVFDRSKDFITVLKPTAEVATLVRNACYDCHSYESNYPWYAKVAPVSWLIVNHIAEGREHVNFSVWGILDDNKKMKIMEECPEEISAGSMPLKGYSMMHPRAKMTGQERNMLSAWFRHGNAAEHEEEHEQ